jgi:excisionase family DNA binding protein
MSVNARPSPLLTVTETAAYLRQSERSIRRKVTTGELPAIRLGGPGSPLRFDSRQLEGWLRANQASPVSVDGLHQEQLRAGAASAERHETSAERLAGYPAAHGDPPAEPRFELAWGGRG